MATYKVIQDVEADDKLIWQLSFRQFVYALIAAFMLYISYISYTKHASFILVLTVPILLFTGFLAFPFGKDQPTEVWALAKLRFFLKPRKRVWAQTGIKELVTITVPKKIEVDRTDGLSQTEVKSRLTALANTIDSRGWAVKNVSGVYQSPLISSNDSERLISTESLAQNVSDDDISDSDDVLDVGSNPAAQQMDQLLSANGTQHRQQLLQTLNQIRLAPKMTSQAPSYTSSQPLPAANTVSTQPATPSVDETGLLNDLKGLNASRDTSLNNMRTLHPDFDPAKPVAPAAPAAPVSAPNSMADTASTKVPDPVIMNLANRNDLNVTVIAHEVNKAKAPKKSTSGDEVLISLH